MHKNKKYPIFPVLRSILFIAIFKLMSSKTVIAIVVY